VSKNRHPRFKKIQKGKSHYFLTVVHIRKDNTTDTRCWGYHEDLELIRQCLRDNYSDFHETMYDYAVIEEHIMDPFAISTGFQEWWKFDFDKEGYRPLNDIPEFARQIVHWGIG